MASIDQLTHCLTSRPQPVMIAGVSVRNFQSDKDIHSFLLLRQQAFARQRLGVRSWTLADFASEFSQKWWWKPQPMWFAEATAAETGTSQIVGTITLALRGNSHIDAKPVVHWLAVLPAWRRRGIGRLLLTTLERAAWDDGFRQVWLETHQAWSAAAAFYHAAGYLPVQTLLSVAGGDCRKG